MYLKINSNYLDYNPFRQIFISLYLIKMPFLNTFKQKRHF